MRDQSVLLKTIVTLDIMLIPPPSPSLLNPFFSQALGQKPVFRETTKYRDITLIPPCFIEKTYSMGGGINMISTVRKKPRASVKNALTK